MLTTNPQAQSLINIPLDWYRQMRDTDPVSLDQRRGGVWNVFRYEDAHYVLSNPALFSSEPAEGSRQPRLPSILGMDDPYHKKLRNIVSQEFTPRYVAQLTPMITELVTGLLDANASRGEMDAIYDFAYPIPITVIATMLGVPVEDQEHFRDWSLALVSGPRYASKLGEDQRTVAIKLRHYLGQKLDEHRQVPQDDLISRLLNAEVDGEKLSQEELLDFCQLLLIAGFETTANLIGNSFVCFADHPEVVAELRHDPSLMKGTVEEILRCYPSVSGAGRVANERTIVGGKTIEKGQALSIHIASANYDERQFSDPDLFDIRRTPNKHLGFGFGLHFCLGAPLARLEAVIALNLLLERYQDIQPDPSQPVEAIQTFFTFGVQHYPVTFHASRQA